MNRIQRVAPLVVVALVASSCVWAPVLHSHPRGPSAPIQILTPRPATLLGIDGAVDVEVRLDDRVDSSTFRAFIRSGSTLRDDWDEITDEFTVAEGFATASLLTQEVGISKLRVTVQRKGRKATSRASTTWSWEPEITTALGCDALDQASCLLPFPNDLYTREDPTSDTGRRVDLHASLANSDGVEIDFTEWNRNDGFSPGTALLVHVPDIDLTESGAAPITDIARSVDRDSPIVIVDATTGERYANWVELDAHATAESTTALIIRPAANFAEGHRYIVALRDLRDDNGDNIEPGRLFRLYRDEIPTFDLETELRRRHMNDILDDLSKAGVARESLYLAWDFTVASERNLSQRLLHIRDDAFDSLGGAAPQFEVTSVSDDVDSLISRRVWGTFEVPLYLTGWGGPGSHFDYGSSNDADALPVSTGTYTASFVCNIPRATISDGSDGSDPVTPGRGVVYGHGTLGAYWEVLAWSQQQMADESNMIYCGTDWIGMSSEDIPNVLAVLQNLSLISTIVDRSQQGILNTLFLGRLIRDPNGFASHEAFQAGADNTSVLLPDEVYFEGASQGGIMGGAATAVSTEWTRATLGVPAMNYSTLLRRSTAFNPLSGLVNAAYPDELERTIGLSLAQMLWDRGENNGYAHHMTDDPYPGTPAHEVLLHEAFGDHQVANVATEVMARTIGAHVVQPALDDGRHLDVDPFWGIPTVSEFPFAGSALVVWDSGTPPPPIANVSPSHSTHGPDPHEDPRYFEPARQQKSAFMAADGELIDVCSGGPCVID